MNLYFLSKDNHQYLVMEGVEEKDAIQTLQIDLEKRRPDFENHHIRFWWDNYFRKWFDYGSHTEFYILQNEDRALNVVPEIQNKSKESYDDDCEMCRI